MKMMINSMFLVFDPSSMGGQLNWFMVGLFLSVYISFYSSNTSFSELILKSIYFLHWELMLGRSSGLFWGQSMMFISIFIQLSLVNFMGLFPYIFTPSSHLSYGFMFAFFMWFGSQMMSWFIKTKILLSHLVPEGTPFILMPFLVVIEIVSSLIRPLTLSIRLVANMSAGHLLISLLGSAINLDNFLVLVLVMMILVLFMILEMSVAIIQAYVFMSLSSLYVKEVE